MDLSLDYIELYIFRADLKFSVVEEVPVSLAAITAKLVSF